MTDEALRILKLLDKAGATGKIEAVRTFPHPHHFQLEREDLLGHVDVTLSTIDALVREKCIEAHVTGDKSKPETYDRYNYVITATGKRLVADAAREAEEAKQQRARQAQAGGRRHQ